MIKYIKDSIRELKHVVWPTREETNNYFITVVLVLLAFGIYLFIASTFFTKSLFGLRDFVNSNKTVIVNEVKKPETKTTSGKVKIETAKVEKTTKVEETKK